MTYASPTWGTHDCLLRLQRLQRWVLRTTGNFQRRTSVRDLHVAFVIFFNFYKEISSTSIWKLFRVLLYFNNNFWDLLCPVICVAFALSVRTKTSSKITVCGHSQDIELLVISASFESWSLLQVYGQFRGQSIKTGADTHKKTHNKPCLR
jgi:hypothetical protein